MASPKTFTAGVECIIEFKGRFFLIRRPAGVNAGGCLSFVGGGVEISDGDNHQDALSCAAIREVREEVGLILKDPVRFVPSNIFVDSGGKLVLNTIFHCELKKATAVVIPSPREVPEYFWMTLEE